MKILGLSLKKGVHMLQCLCGRSLRSSSSLSGEPMFSPQPWTLRIPLHPTTLRPRLPAPLRLPPSIFHPWAVEGRRFLTRAREGPPRLACVCVCVCVCVCARSEVIAELYSALLVAPAPKLESAGRLSGAWVTCFHPASPRFLWLARAEWDLN
jgi:hypothetical protein